MKLIGTGFAAACLAAFVGAAGTYTTSGDDETNFPEFESTMTSIGSDYQWKSVQVTTADGYILNMFRIMADENGDFTDDRGSLGPILLVHGLTADARTWVDNDQDPGADSFPVQLFDLGYDVYFANHRGSIFSRGHTTLDVTDPADQQAYWDWERKELAELDLPAMLSEVVTDSNTCK